MVFFLLGLVAPVALACLAGRLCALSVISALVFPSLAWEVIYHVGILWAQRRPPGPCCHCLELLLLENLLLVLVCLHELLRGHGLRLLWLSVKRLPGLHGLRCLPNL